MDPETQKELLKLQSQLTRLISRLEPKKSTLPAGTFAALATAEGEIDTALGNMDRPKRAEGKTQ